MSKSLTPIQLRLKSLVDAARLLSADDLARESELVRTKWFEYRFISPMQATLLFRKAYEDVFKRAFRTYVDVERAGEVVGSGRLAFNTNPRERTQLWKARQRADEVGMRYEDYIELSFDFVMRRKRKKFPRPNQLHHSGKGEKLWLEDRDQAWAERIREEIVRVGNVPAYRIENYRGLEPQDAFRRFVVDRVRTVPVPINRAILRYSIEMVQVPPEAFKGIVPDEQFDAQRQGALDDARYYDTRPIPLPEHGAEALWPSCFGLPHAADGSRVACSGCALIGKCRTTAEAILEKVVEQTGSRTPLADHKKNQARVRKQRQRMRERSVGQTAMTAAQPGPRA